jgi:uncharacterized membrane protein
MHMNNNIIVTVSAANMRSWGRQSLAGHWKMAVFGTLIYYILSMAPLLLISSLFANLDVVDFAAFVYTLLVLGPLMLGYYVFIIAICRKKPTGPAEVFYGFERFGKAFGLFLAMFARILLWSCLFIIPGILAALRYSLAFFVLADNPDIPISAAINESQRMMRGNKWKYFCVQLCFFGWSLLASLPSSIATQLLTSGGHQSPYVALLSFVLSAGMFWLMPYITATTVGFYEVANGNLRRQEPVVQMNTADAAQLSVGATEQMPEIEPEQQPEQQNETETEQPAEPKGEADDTLKVEVHIRS